MNGRPNIILVHGAWAEGSCWSGVNGGQIMTALGARHRTSSDGKRPT